MHVVRSVRQAACMIQLVCSWSKYMSLCVTCGRCCIAVRVQQYRQTTRGLLAAAITDDKAANEC